MSLLSLLDWKAKAAAALFAVLALWGAVKLFDHYAVERHKAKVEAAAAKGREMAGEERAADAARNAVNEEKMHAAINAAPTGAPLHPAARALACERLRQHGRVPAACRPEGGNGGQAGAR